MLLTMLPVGEANKKIVDHARKSLAEAFPDFSCIISKKFCRFQEVPIIQQGINIIQA